MTSPAATRLPARSPKAKTVFLQAHSQAFNEATRRSGHAARCPLNRSVQQQRPMGASRPSVVISTGANSVSRAVQRPAVPCAADILQVHNQPHAPNTKASALAEAFAIPENNPA